MILPKPALLPATHTNTIETYLFKARRALQKHAEPASLPGQACSCRELAPLQSPHLSYDLSFHSLNLDYSLCSRTFVAVHVYNLWLLLFLFILFKFNFHVTVLFGAVFLGVLQHLVVAFVALNLAYRFKILLLCSWQVFGGSQELIWLLGNIFFFLTVTTY